MVGESFYALRLMLCHFTTNITHAIGMAVFEYALPRLALMALTIVAAFSLGAWRLGNSRREAFEISFLGLLCALLPGVLLF